MNKNFIRHISDDILKENQQLKSTIISTKQALKSNLLPTQAMKNKLLPFSIELIFKYPSLTVQNKLLRSSSSQFLKKYNKRNKKRRKVNLLSQKWTKQKNKWN